MSKEYEEIMRRLSEQADENGMVSLDAIAEVVNQELECSLHPSANEQFELADKKISEVKSMDIKEMEKILKENNAYIISSIDGKGNHIGRFKGFYVDADNDLVIDVDTDGMSCTG